MVEGLMIAVALLVAFSNGANDNFKGFATVWGSDALSYQQALILATVATVAGSLASLFLADGLVQSFSGKGLVPDEVVNAPAFMLGMASGTVVTLLLATRLGLPVSTTHALIGGLIGAGLGQPGSVVHWGPLTSMFLAPLLISPLLAAALSVMAYRLTRARVREKDCACLVVSSSDLQTNLDGLPSGIVLPLVSAVVAPAAACEQLNAPVRVSVSRTLDRMHILSAQSICFARGVNDTPKIAALFLVAQAFDMRLSVVMIAAVMALGGLLFARNVAQTMSRRVTCLDHDQGLAANVTTALMVLFASKLGLPVSTTHVAVGAIAGVGASTRSLNWQALRNVLLSWVATLPLAASMAFVATKFV